MTTAKEKRERRHKELVPGHGILRRDAFAALVLGLLVAVIYFPATQAGFVWDDEIMMGLDAVRNWGGIWGIWFDPVGVYRQEPVREGHYWPLLYTTFWLEHKLWGFSPAGYHIVNILLHFANTVLLWRLLARLAVPGAWFAAVVFAMHPLNVESVAWVMGRKDLISSLFYLAAVLMWLRFIESPHPRRYATALLLLAAGMFCKSIVVTLPVTLLILHWWKQGRITRTDLLRVTPFFLVGLAIAAFDLLFYEKVNLSFDYSVLERMLIAAHCLWFYVGKLLWPVELAVIYPHWDVSAANTLGWLYVVTALAVPVTLWFLRRRTGRGLLACVLFFAVTLSPVLGFLDYGYMNISFVADRYQYLAGIGLIVFFVSVATYSVKKLTGVARNAVRGVALVLLVLLGIATWNQSGVYKDEVTLFTHGASVNSQSWAVNRYAGLAFLELGQFEEAEKHFRRALKINPSYTLALFNLGETLRMQQRYKESLEFYRAALNLDLGSASVHAGMGVSLLRLKRYEEAVSSMERALAIKPNLPRAHTFHYFTGYALQEMNQLDGAGEHYEKALQINPHFWRAIDRLAGLRFGQGNYNESLGLYKTLVKIEPENAVAHYNVGVALLKLGRNEEALVSFERTLSLDPTVKPALTNRDMLRNRMRQKAK